MDRKTTQNEWDEAERRVNTGRRPATYAVHTCPVCGATVREGAWGGRAANLNRHLDAHERKGEVK